MRCMPWPLAVLCWLDNRAHDRRGGGPDGSDLLCQAHDGMLSLWLTVKVGRH
jgi:hypothetical protein